MSESPIRRIRLSVTAAAMAALLGAGQVILPVPAPVALAQEIEDGTGEGTETPTTPETPGTPETPVLDTAAGSVEWGIDLLESLSPFSADNELLQLIIREYANREDVRTGFTALVAVIISMITGQPAGNIDGKD